MVFPNPSIIITNPLMTASIWRVVVLNSGILSCTGRHFKVSGSSFNVVLFILVVYSTVLVEYSGCQWFAALLHLFSISQVVASDYVFSLFLILFDGGMILFHISYTYVYMYMYMYMYILYYIFDTKLFCFSVINLFCCYFK